ncbi:hypothetical protein MSMEG_3968 [Mycolicibacterium smegmatis MC2 155]|uniref:Uncharacterized protein n=1 Tax=Mycolicibacterium smegmatis (strain ATCC 700084 / mc(2)155) TaxID=246196 RepID=A0QZC0_MYCS2|nr:hypothetical protein MSMEG_3968 [Mycolicibacterium smegmatis MC2 155]
MARPPPESGVHRGVACRRRRPREDVVERARRGGCRGRDRRLRLHRERADPRGVVDDRDTNTFGVRSGETRLREESRTVVRVG